MGNARISKGAIWDSADQHALIEEAIRAMSETDENGERRLERLERFNTVCPYV